MSATSIDLWSTDLLPRNLRASLAKIVLAKALNRSRMVTAVDHNKVSSWINAIESINHGKYCPILTGIVLSYGKSKNKLGKCAWKRLKQLSTTSYMAASEYYPILFGRFIDWKIEAKTFDYHHFLRAVGYMRRHGTLTVGICKYLLYLNKLKPEHITSLSRSSANFMSYSGVFFGMRAVDFKLKKPKLHQVVMELLDKHGLKAYVE